MNTPLIDSLITALENSQFVNVTFNTKAGHVRTMKCTRVLEYVPENERDGINNSKLNGPLIVCVWDYQNSAFRSFRKDSVISFEVVV